MQPTSDKKQPFGESGANSPVPSAPSPAAKRLLLIEDEPATRLVLLNQLRKAGFEVDVASNGHVALQKLATHCPDAIFMDLLLPDVRGVDVIKEARRNTKFGNKPIYVCTSATRMDVWTRRGTKAGATKVFDRASTPVEQIVAEVRADFTDFAPGTSAGAAATPPSDKGEANGRKEGSGANQTQPRLTAGEFGTATPAQAPAGHAEASIQADTQPPSAMKRLFGTFGLGRAKPAATSTPAPVGPPPLPTPPTASAPIPAAAAIQGEAPADADSTSLTPGIQGGETASSTIGLTSAVGPEPSRVAVLTLDQTGRIASADETCAAMFGWKLADLVGQNAMVLLKDGLDNDLGRFLQRLKAAERHIESRALHVVGHRKDGTEFPASITPLTWNSDTTLTRRGDGSTFLWTAVFRDLSRSGNAPGQTAPDGQPAVQSAIGLAPVGAAGDTWNPDRHATPQGTDEQTQKQIKSASAEAPAENEAAREGLSAQIRSDELELQQARAALEQATAERNQFAQQLQELEAGRTDLEKQLLAESHTKDEVLKSSREIHEQFESARAAAERAEAAHQQETARSNQLENELARLRLAHEEISGRLAAEKQAAEQAGQRNEQLENQLRSNAGDLELVKSDAGKHEEEHARLEAELRAQLDATKAATERAEAALREEAKRNKDFEERLRVLCESLKAEQSERAKRFDGEVGRLWQAQDELQEKLAGEQQAAAESLRRAESLENHLRDRSSEVERVKAELEQQTAEQKRIETDWREKLQARDALTDKLEAALLAAEEVNRQSEQELTGLRREREELNAKLATEQRAAAESRQRVGDLERRLRENALELQRVTAELKRSGQGKGFETELTGLHQMRDMLSLKLTAEQRTNAESKKRTDDLEGRLRTNNAELERVKADADKHAEEQARLESELQEKLSAAMTAAAQAETELEEKAAKCTEFEQELVGLRHTRDELDARLKSEQQAAAESKQRNSDLEKQLRQNAGELEQVRAAASKHAAEHERLEFEMRAQLESARTAAARAETSLKEEAARNRGFEDRMRMFGNELRMEQSETIRRFEKELADSSRLRHELEDRLAAEQRASAESKRRSAELEGKLRESAGELEHVKVDLSKKVAERRDAEAKFREQLKTAQTTAGRAEATCKEETQRSSRMEKELAGLRQGRDDLKVRLTAEQQAAAKSRRRIKELEKKVHESASSLERVEAELKKRAAEERAPDAETVEQLAAARAAAAQAEEALKEKSAEMARLDQELVRFREVGQALQAKLVEEQRGGAKSKRRAKELEKQLRDSATAFARFRADLEGRVAESGRRASDLEAAKAAAQQAETTREEVAARATQLAEEMDGLRQMHDELSARFKAGQQTAADSNRRIEDLEKRLRESAAELGRAKAALENQAADRSRKDATQQSTADNVTELTEELCRLRENEAARTAELSEVERRVRESVASLARVTADLEKERGERRRIEQRSTSLTAQLQQLHGDLKLHLESEKATQDRVGDLEQQLRDREDRLTRVSADWQKEAADRQLAEEQLRSFGDMSAQLRKYLALFEESKKVFKRTQDDLEARLQASLKTLSDSESRLQKETSERQRLEEALATAQRGGQEQSERSALEMAKLQSDLQMEQFERKRLEGDALQSRYASLDSTRVGRSMVNSFRRQVREPADHLIQATRRLLEIELEEEPKKLVESVLEDALLLQTNLQESGSSTGGTPSDKEGGGLQA